MPDSEVSAKPSIEAKPPSRLRDPIWQFVAAVVGVVAIIITIIVYLASRPQKNLRVEILSNSPVVSVNADVGSEIEILYQGKPVQSLSVILLKLENTGNQPILDSEYSDPIRITLSQNAQIGASSIQETRPIGIPLTSTVTSNNRIELSAVLLNPGDQAILRILAINNDGTISITGRIAGIQEIEQITGLQENNGFQLTTSTLVAVGIILLFVEVIFLVGVVDSVWFIRLRMRFGYDPNFKHYKSAQKYALQGNFRFAASELEDAIFAKAKYYEKSIIDPAFVAFRTHPEFSKLAEKYESRNDDPATQRYKSAQRNTREGLLATAHNDLEYAIYADPKYLEESRTDPALAQLRARPEYHQLVEKYESRNDDEATEKYKSARRNSLDGHFSLALIDLECAIAADRKYLEESRTDSAFVVLRTKSEYSTLIEKYEST